MRLFPKSKLTWILVLFIAYAYYTEYVSNSPSFRSDSSVITIGADKNKSSGEEFSEKVEDVSDKIINKIRQNETGKAVMDALVKKSIEDKFGKGELQVISARNAGSLTIVDVVRGSGIELKCGAKAALSYDAFLSSGIKFDSTILKEGAAPIAIHIGGGQVIKGLEAGVVGMLEGGRRKISIPAELAFDSPEFTNTLISKGEAVLYDVTLLKIMDGPYKTGMAINTISATIGSGNKVLCGDKVTIRYNISNLAGEPIPHASGQIEFVVGGGVVPMGFESAVLNMQSGGSVTTQIPYELLASAGKNQLTPEIKFTEGETVQAHIELLSSSAK